MEWIKYPIPNKRDLVNRLDQAIIFSKFDMKSGFWQIQLHENDRYKTAFTTSFGHYEWNVMPFGLKNALSEFQNIMNEIFNPFSHFSIVYIDDILIFSKSIDEHWKHLNISLHQNGRFVTVLNSDKGHLSRFITVTFPGVTKKFVTVQNRDKYSLSRFICYTLKVTYHFQLSQFCQCFEQ